MKKWLPNIFFPLLVLFVFVNANQKTTATSSFTATSNTSFNANSNDADAEIEHCHIYSHPVSNNFQGFQKLPGYLDVNTNGPVITSLVSSPVTCSGNEPFHNNYLSHNYPSHNFW